MQFLNQIFIVREKVLSNKLLVAAIPIIIWLAVNGFFYRKMINKQEYYVVSKARDQQSYYQSIIKTSQNLSNFIINNKLSPYDSVFTNEGKIPGDDSQINFNLLLINPVYERIRSEQEIIYRSNPANSTKDFDFNIGQRRLRKSRLPGDHFELSNEYAYVVPLDKQYNKIDTVTITFSVPAIVDEMNNLHEQEYFFLPPTIIESELKEDFLNSNISLSGHSFRQMSDSTCRILARHTEQLIRNKIKEISYFTELIKVDSRYYDVVFFPVVDMSSDFSGYVFSFSVNGFQKVYFMEFLKRIGVATLGIAIIFLLYYRNFTNEIILSKQNIAIMEDQKKLKIAKEKAEDANMIKSEFLANMSHEIRTPMNTVLGFTDLLSNQINDQQQKKYLTAISSGTKNLLVLINDILDLSKIEAGKMKISYEPANPALIFKEIENIFSDKVADKNIQMTIEVAPSIPKYLLLDEVRLRQIMFNLIGNAIKFTQNGFVKISVFAELLKGHQNKVNLIVKVKDTGIGIPEEYKEEIFNAFQQQDGRMTKKYGGSGLGLSISRKLASLMNGDITLESKVGEGSTFTLHLRMIEIVHLEDEKQTESTPPESNENRKILFKEAVIMIVDDVDHNRFLIREYLKNSKLYIHEAVNGKEAIDSIRMINPDLVLMDIRMPVMDGIEATEIIKNDPELSKIPIIALTASVMEEEISEIKKSGFDDFLRKPMKLKELSETLANYLPYETLENSATKPKTKTKVKTTEFQRHHINDILPELENTLLEEWNKVKDGGFIDEISNFGIKIKKLGERFSFDPITSWGIDLCDSADSFDVNKMKKILNSFPGLIQTVKNMRQ